MANRAQVVTITMASHWRSGLPLHIKNLSWALAAFTHEIYIVTTPEIKTAYEKVFPDVRFIEFNGKGATRSEFWKIFPEIVRERRIDGDLFLLMKLDVWFYEPILSLPQRTDEIINHTPFVERHSMTVDDEIHHYRIWEGANLFNGEIIQHAIEDGIKFWAAPTDIYPYFFENEREEWEEKLGGEIGLYQYQYPETMDEVCFYCPMIHRTRAVFDDRAIHLEGAETIHQSAPKFCRDKEYLNLTAPLLRNLAKNFWYLDPYMILAALFLCGDYETPSRFEWNEMKDGNKALIKMLTARYREWMDSDDQKRLEQLLGVL